MIDVTPYFSFENAKEALMYYEEAIGAYNVTRTALTPEFAKQMQIEVDNYEDTTMEGTFTILGQKIAVTDEFGFPKQHSIILSFEKSDLEKITEYYQMIQMKNLVKIIFELQKDPFGMNVFQFIDKYEITWMFTEINS